MKLYASLAILSTAVLSCLAQSPVKVVYDATYDDPNYPLLKTACSDGANGLASKWPTLGNIPNFPNVAGVPGVVWNSPLCGTCWKLQFVDAAGATHAITVTAVDAAGTFNVAKTAFTNWAGTPAVNAGFVMATATQVPCGF